MSSFGSRPGLNTTAEAAALTAISALVGGGPGTAVSKNADGTFSIIAVDTPAVDAVVGTSVFPGGTVGSVLFISTNSVIQQSNANFFWDNVNQRLGIGTTVPAAALCFSGNTAATSGIAFGPSAARIYPAGNNNIVFDRAAGGFTTRWDTSGNTVMFGTASGALSFALTSANQVTALTLDTSQNAQFAAKVTSYNGVATTGWGIPALSGYARPAAGQTGAITLSTYTVGAADGSFIVSANILITTATTHNFIVTCTYTDEGNTSRTLTFTFSVVAGTTLNLIANTGGTVPYEGIPLHIRAKAATTITIATANGGGTNFTSVVYNGEGSIIQIA